MKHIIIVTFIFLSGTIMAQISTSNKSEYKSIAVSFSSYSKPKAAELVHPFYETATMYEDARRNLGISVNYSQMYFIKNMGLEYGIGIDLMFINNQYNIRIEDSTSNYSSKIINLGSSRTMVGLVNLPLYYVHRIQLGKQLTLFSKIGINTKILAHSQKTGIGAGDWLANRVAYQVEYITSEGFSNFPLKNVIFSGAAGASLGWNLKNGNMLGIQLMLSTQLFQNSIMSKINDIVYTEDDVVHFGSEKFYPTHYYDNDGNLVINKSTDLGAHYAQHRISNFSLGMSYTFVKDSEKRQQNREDKKL
jgi:hypothetical protein